MQTQQSWHFRTTIYKILSIKTWYLVYISSKTKTIIWGKDLISAKVDWRTNWFHIELRDYTSEEKWLCLLLLFISKCSNSSHLFTFYHSSSYFIFNSISFNQESLFSSKVSPHFKHSHHHYYNFVHISWKMLYISIFIIKHFHEFNTNDVTVFKSITTYIL